MRIAICDDDSAASNALYQDITQLAEEQLHSSQKSEPVLAPVITRSDIFTDSDEFLFAAETEHYDLAFVDIELGEESGIQLSNKLLRLHPDLQIIFFSGYDDYYLDVYNVDHVYFLKKPVDPERLKTALLAAQRRILSLQDKFLTIANKQGVFRIALQDILFLEKSRRLILIHTADGEIYKTYGKFSDFEDSLKSLYFQCHTSYIVNFRFVSEMTDRKFLVSPHAGLHIAAPRPLHGAAAYDNGGDPGDGAHYLEQAIPISKTYYTQAKEAFLKCLMR